MTTESNGRQIGAEVCHTARNSVKVSGAIPTVLGVILCVAGICVEGALTESERSPVTTGPVALIAELHQIKAFGKPVDSRFQQVPIRVLSGSQSTTVQQIRPPVKEFIKRVVVPILVERYVGRLNRDRLLAGTGEPS